MNLTDKQKGVRNGMLLGGSISFVLFIGSALMNPFGYAQNLLFVDRLVVVMRSAELLALCLGFSIGLLAKHRFFSPADIDGRGLTAATVKAKELQSVLQNTLEQSLLALLVYLIWATVMPSACLSVVPVAAIAFLAGRILFYLGYANGGPSRAISFTLTFYPSMLMLFTSLFMLGYHELQLIYVYIF